MDEKVICCKCDLEMRLEKTTFSYLGHNFVADILRCPRCKQVFIPEDLVKGKMHEVEALLEDK